MTKPKTHTLRKPNGQFNGSTPYKKSIAPPPKPGVRPRSAQSLARMRQAVLTRMRCLNLLLCHDTFPSPVRMPTALCNSGGYREEIDQAVFNALLDHGELEYLPIQSGMTYAYYRAR